MSELTHEELISAYLDNEVTVEQRAYVERLLEEDPQSRQMLEELRALRGSLTSLPQHGLEGDFRDRVMEAAEREMLLAPSRDLRTAAIATGGSQGSSTARRFVRPLAWAGVTVAAALLVMAFAPMLERHEGEQLAQVPQRDSAPAAKVTDRSASTLELRSATTPEAETPRMDASIHAKGAADAHRAREEAVDKDFATMPPNPMPPDTVPPEASPTAPMAKAAMSDDNLMIVRCQVNPTNFRAPAFTKLLRDQGIEWEPPAKLEAEAANDADGDQRALPEPSSAPDSSIAGEGTTEGEDVQIVVVDATVGQLETTLAALNRRSDEFEEVVVDPAPNNVSQAMLATQYNRFAFAESKDINDTAQAAAEPGQTAPSEPLTAKEIQQDANGSQALRSFANRLVQQLPPDTEVAQDEAAPTDPFKQKINSRARRVEVEVPVEYQNLLRQNVSQRSGIAAQQSSPQANDLERQRVDTTAEQAETAAQPRRKAAGDSATQQAAQGELSPQAKMRAVFVLQFNARPLEAPSAPATP